MFVHFYTPIKREFYLSSLYFARSLKKDTTIAPRINPDEKETIS